MTTLRRTLTFSLALAAAALPALAEDYDNTVRLGMFIVTYDAKAPDVSGPFTPTGLNLKVDTIYTPYLAYIRHLNQNFELQFAFGVPPTTKSIGVGPAKVGSVPFDGQEVSTTKWFSPSLLLDYTFFPSTTFFRPYLGVGVNFTKFYDNTATAAGNAANGGPTSISLTNCWSPAATVGFKLTFDPHWHAIASYSYANIRSDYTSNTDGIIRTTNIKFNPAAFVVAAGYSF